MFETIYLFLVFRKLSIGFLLYCGIHIGSLYTETPTLIAYRTRTNDSGLGSVNCLTEIPFYIS
jgi:hypothetical protein